MRTCVCYLKIQRSLGKEGNARFANEGHLPFRLRFLLLYWSSQGIMAEFRMFKCLTLAFMRGYGQQFPCILRVAPTKRLLSSCALYDVHEKSLIEGECELNY